MIAGRQLPQPVTERLDHPRYSPPMQDAIAGFQAAPVWAQIAMACFAALAVYMLFESTLRKRKFRNHFNGIAREVGAEPQGRDWPFTFSTRSNDRTFTVTHDYRGGKGTSYRGPRGYLLTTSTRLAGSRWPLHQVDVTPVPKLLSRLVSRKAPTGDADFDSRFIVVEDGLPVRDGWLNADTRTAIASFLADAPLDGRVWIHEGELQYVLSDPWKGIDGPAIRALLQRQAVLASVLERRA